MTSDSGQLIICLRSMFDHVYSAERYDKIIAVYHISVDMVYLGNSLMPSSGFMHVADRYIQDVNDEIGLVPRYLPTLTHARHLMDLVPLIIAWRGRLEEMTAVEFIGSS